MSRAASKAPSNNRIVRRLACEASAGSRVSSVTRHRTRSLPRCPAPEPWRRNLVCSAVQRVRTFCAFSRRPAGPLAPPPRRARSPSLPLALPLRRRQRRATGAKYVDAGRLTYSKFHRRRRGVPAAAAGIVRGRSEPVKVVCDRRTTAPVELPGERTREDDLDRTCPDQEMAAIASRDTSDPGSLPRSYVSDRARSITLIRRFAPFVP